MFLGVGLGKVLIMICFGVRGPKWLPDITTDEMHLLSSYPSVLLVGLQPGLCFETSRLNIQESPAD